MNLRHRPLVKGAAALFAAGVLNRIIGTIYRVLLVRTAGEDVVGLFQMTLPIYRLAWLLATAGLPVAIAKLTADAIGNRDEQKAYRFGKIGFSLTVFTAAMAALLLLATEPIWSERLLTDARTDITMKVLPLLLFPAALSAAVRGMLQGREKLAPIAASSLLEATSRVPVVLLLVGLLLPFGASWAAAGIALGLCFGEVVSLLYLAFVARRGSQPKPLLKKMNPTAKTRLIVVDQVPYMLALAGMAAPMLISGLINGSLGLINVGLIPRHLMETGVTSAEATALYGRLFGMAIPVLYMPMVAVHPLVHAAIPAIAKRMAEGRTKSVKDLLVKCFSVAAIVSLFAAVGFWLYGEQIGALLYGIEGLGVLIAPLAFAAPFIYIDHICVGILYGLGRTGIALVNSVIGSILRLYLITVFVSDPRFGIVGALWAIIADYALTTLLHAVSLLVIIPKELRRK